MPQPGRKDVHTNRPLTNISVAYIQSQESFIADKVFPIIPVDKMSDTYYKYDKDAWFRDEAKKRAPATESEGSGYGISSDSFSCETYAFHKDVPWDVEANADAGLDGWRDATEFVTQKLLLKREILFNSSYMTTGVWGTDYTGTNTAPGPGQVYQWSDFTNSDPITDIDNAKEAINSQTGYMPNTMVIVSQVLRYLKNHTYILDRIKYTQRGVVTLDLLAALFEVPRIVVARSIKATANEGQATQTYDYITGKIAWLGYVEPNPGLMKPSAGYIFAWKNLTRVAGNGYGIAISQFEMRKLKADRVEGEMCFDQKIVAPDMGVFFNTIVA